jgi:hypothetical protein
MTSRIASTGSSTHRPSWWPWALTGLAGVGLAVSAAVVAGSWRFGLMVASSILATCGIVPYLRETVRRTTRPRLVTWGTWSLLTAVAGTASASVGDYPSAVFSFVGTVATAAVVAVGVRFGDRAIGALDAACLVLVVVGVAAWLTLDQPGLAVLAACLIDFVGLVPTAVHAWRRPEEETATTFALVAAGGACAGLAAWGELTVTALAYPTYVALSMGAVALLTLRGTPVEPARTATPTPLAPTPAPALDGHIVREPGD